MFIDWLKEGTSDEQEAEAEANTFAKDGLIPRDLWLRSDAYRLGSEGGVLNLAKQLGVHPAIVAGSRARPIVTVFRNLPSPLGLSYCSVPVACTDLNEGSASKEIPFNGSDKSQ